MQGYFKKQDFSETKVSVFMMSVKFSRGLQIGLNVYYNLLHDWSKLL